MTDRINDPARLAAIARTGLLDVPPIELLDSLTRLAAKTLKVPMALVTLVTDSSQFLASGLGVPPEMAESRQTPLSHSFCKYVVADDRPISVADVREVERFRDNPAIQTVGVVAYAGVPLHLPDGNVIGAFCVVDLRPREWTAEENELLNDFAVIASRVIESRLPPESAIQPPGRFAYILDLIPGGLYVCDRKSSLLYCNRRAREMWGNRPSLGTPEASVYQQRKLFDTRGEALAVHDMPVQQVLNAGLGGERELFLGSGPEQLTIMFNTAIVKDPYGAVTGAVCIMHDTTALRRAARLRDDLLALVSHELRTPLTVINGMANFLTHSPETIPAETRGSAVADIVSSGRRMERMVENMLLLSRLEHEAADPEPILVRMAIEEALDRHRYDFPGSHVEVLSVERSLVVLGVPAWVHLILVNLLRNAEQYGDGKLPHILQAGAHDGHVDISLCNSGDRQTDEEYSGWFEPFYRGAATALTVSGAGLGLTVASRLAESQGGKLHATSWDSGQGTMITLRLPALTGTR